MSLIPETGPMITAEAHFEEVNHLKNALAVAVKDRDEAREQREHYIAENNRLLEELKAERKASFREQRDRLADECRALLDSEEVQKSWPLDGTKRAAKPKDTHSSATATVKFRRLLAINAALASVKGGSQ